MHERALPDGRSFEIVKRFHTPESLAAELPRQGFAVDPRLTDWAFLLGRAVRDDG